MGMLKRLSWGGATVPAAEMELNSNIIQLPDLVGEFLVQELQGLRRLEEVSANYLCYCYREKLALPRNLDQPE